jgi:N-acetylglucosaminyl-diphospho-decaprenol L-rhamnosyltransferase
VNEKNLGYAGSNNRAMREFTTQPYIWLLNSDTETGRHSLEQLYTYMEAHPEIGSLGPQLVYPNGSFQSVGGYFPNPLNVFLYLIPLTKLLPVAIKCKLHQIAAFPQPIPREGVELDYVTGAAMFLRKKSLDEAGLLAEDFYMYFEETDLCLRQQRLGWKCVVINTEPVMHVYGGTFKTAYDRKRLSITLESLNIFIKKNYTGWRRWAMLLEVWLFGALSLRIKQLKNLSR